MIRRILTLILILNTLLLLPARATDQSMNVDNIADQLFFVTVRLECFSPDKDGKLVSNIGTGFLVSYKWNNKEGIFLVTNKHVLKGVTKVKFFMLQSNGKGPILGKIFSIDINDVQNIWCGHPNDAIDVAIIPITQIINEAQKKNLKLFYKYFTKEFLPTAEQAKELYAVEDVMFVGYPVSLYDKVNYLPIIRRGITATPFNVNYEGIPQFLIDAAVFPGSSGSPVFIMNQGPYTTKRGNYTGPRFLFLGMISRGYGYSEAIKEAGVKNPEILNAALGANQLVGLGNVIKSSTIFETIEAYLRFTGEIK